MRVLTIAPGPAFSVADVHRGWVKAFRQLGVEVADFNLDDRLEFYEQALAHSKVEIEDKAHRAAELAAQGIRAALFDFWPDWLFITSGFFVPPLVYQVARARGIKIAQLFTESPYEDGNQLQRAPFIDIALINDPTNLDRFAEHCAALYVPHAYDPDIHHAGVADPDLACDFTFVGSGYPSRIAFLEAVDWTGLTVRLAGNWRSVEDSSPLAPFLQHDRDECVDNTEAARLYRAAKVSANLYRREAQDDEYVTGWAMGPREVELAACGTFFLRDPRPESDLVLPMLPTFTGSDDFGERVRWWAAHERERQDVAAKAARAVEDRTFQTNVTKFLQLADTVRSPQVIGV